MLDNHGFDIWANGYDQSVNASDADNDYPFAGYKKMINAIYGTVMQKHPVKVLDIGVGTGTLAAKLYEGGNEITAIDFSREMLDIARAKMPNATFIQHDFTQGLPAEIASAKFDFIVSTYALHHLTDDEKIPFIKALLHCIDETGIILIGDVSFPDRAALEQCAALADDEWDDEEYYFVFEELRAVLQGDCTMSYHPYSHCGGILEISRR
ncbi:MAG: class I SAM-dependent methyltransferase [Defluviitaleaceae bacterium]|nr:class I SAM-dependent methyltransferase [Defluviitaleaceae bacterium]